LAIRKRGERELTEMPKKDFVDMVLGLIKDLK